MTIRLNKVTRDFNVGITTVVEFLQKKGITVEPSPNTKITDEQYAMLAKEFSADKALKGKSDLLGQQRQQMGQGRDSVSIEGYGQDRKKKSEEAKAPETRQRYTVIGKIDLSNPQRQAVVTPVRKPDTDSAHKTEGTAKTTEAASATTTTAIGTTTAASTATATTTASTTHAAGATAAQSQSSNAEASKPVTATGATSTTQSNPIVTPQAGQTKAEATAAAGLSQEASSGESQATTSANKQVTGSGQQAVTGNQQAATSQASQQQANNTQPEKPSAVAQQAATSSQQAQQATEGSQANQAAQTTMPAQQDATAPTKAQDTEVQATKSAQGTQSTPSEAAGTDNGHKPDVLAVETSPGSGVYTVAHTEPVARLNVVGQIDLDAINQSTRPKKKSKEERKKEREEKEKQRSDQRKQMKEAIIKEIRRDAPANRPGESATSSGTGEATAQGEAARKKRTRINKTQEKVDITNPNNFQRPDRSSGKPAAGGSGGRGSSGDGRNDSRTGRGTGRGDMGRGSKAVVAPKQEVSDEDVAKQVKETLARLTSKSKNKGVKYRKDKRDLASSRMHDRMSQEEAESKILKLTEFVTANELATMMNVPVTSVIGTCMSVGIMVSINQRLDAETINLVADEFGFKTEYVSAQVAQAIVEEADAEEDLEPRAPIVTVMGHVDHGKTSLLDYIRKSNVIAGEAGGITQHIGAYNVTMEDGRQITFLDTPGHEAFTAMRARGAKVTDIAIIIVAADDNVMPQTKEAINHAMAAGVPIVFAINKIDKPGANPEKIKEELAAMNFLVEDWGGKYQSQDISAKKGIGVSELMEKVLLEAEMLELKANPNRKATGSIIESSLDKGRGYVATVLVSNGTLKVGDIVLAGTNYGRVKAMFNERNQRMKEAHPAEPALILGLNGAPAAGDTFHVIETEQEAREITGKREQLQREQGLRTQKRIDLAEMGRRLALGDFHELNIIVKGDVDGSVEALSDSLIKLSTEHIQVNVIHKGVGQISESDVSLAAASNAIIVGFQVRPSGGASRLAEQEGVDIRKYSVIYDAIEEVKAAMIGMLAPTVKEQVTATIEVREVFNISKVGMVAGAMVKTGKVKRSDKARLIRDGIVIFTGAINALKRFKDDVKEVGSGFECGISLVACNDIKTGDVIESFEEVEVERTLE